MQVSCASVAVVCFLFLFQRSLADQDSQENSVSSTVLQDWDSSCDDCECGQYREISKIVEGEEAKPHEFPWIVYITQSHRFHCGGTLITPRHVLTAAHCTYGVLKELLVVTVGAHYRNVMTRGLQRRRVVKMTAHAGFTMENFHDDIAVLELDKPVIPSSIVRIACLPQSDNQDYTGMQAVVAGWGSPSELVQPTLSLQKVSVPIMSVDKCKSLGYPATRITDNMICAGLIYGGKDACQGDSGGPMNAVINNVVEVIGIVSWGKGCARPFYPGVYTRVAKYLGWIDEQLNGECRCSSGNPLAPRSSITSSSQHSSETNH